MQPFNYVLAAVFALLIGGGAIVAYRRSKPANTLNPKHYYPYTPNKIPTTVGSGYSGAGVSPAGSKGPGCGCNAGKH